MLYITIKILTFIFQYGILYIDKTNSHIIGGKENGKRHINKKIILS